MKVTSMIARFLMGAIFVFFGSNHLYAFLPSPPPPHGVAGQYMVAMMASGYLYVVGVCEVVPGLLLLIGRFVPLALMVLAAVIFNIEVTGALLARAALPMGTFLILLWILTAYEARPVLLPLLRARTDANGSRNTASHLVRDRMAG
ncbi:MAG TPA: DoxX family membrane protein [Terracidiphilus sp.]|nr:DoxX family membrane protein [Terracidiphilus sp.]